MHYLIKEKTLAKILAIGLVKWEIFKIEKADLQEAKFIHFDQMMFLEQVLTKNI